MSEQALILHDAAAVAPIQLTPEAIALKNSALECAALIGRVTNAQEQETAVAAQKELKRVADLLEKARVEATKPLLDAQRKLKSTVDTHKDELTAELTRVSRLVGDFQALELAKVRAAEALRLAELNRLEREKQAELAKAKSHEEMERIHERANMQAAAIPVVAPVRAQGQIVREEWDVTVTDIWTLARAHPSCVKIEPRLSEIKQLLDAGVPVAGVSAKKVSKAGVRLGREQKAIDIAA